MIESSSKKVNCVKIQIMNKSKTLNIQNIINDSQKLFYNSLRFFKNDDGISVSEWTYNGCVIITDEKFSIYPNDKNLFLYYNRINSLNNEAYTGLCFPSDPLCRNALNYEYVDKFINEFVPHVLSIHEFKIGEKYTIDIPDNNLCKEITTNSSNTNNNTTSSNISTSNSSINNTYVSQSVLQIEKELGSALISNSTDNALIKKKYRFNRKRINRR
jgi:hypothetical protein